jgi:hypothetical protein
MLLALEVEHILFECVGMFCCPGKYGPKDSPTAWFPDLTKRPNARDLQKAEIFISEILETLD